MITPSIRLLKRLGKGGMGTVWLAEHETLQAQVVVKFLADRLSNDPTSRARFSREASSAARVRSPHVVQTLDHGVTDDGTPFIVLELLEGHDLAVELRNRIMDPHEVAHIVEHVCVALSRAHEEQIVHRDIKPSNIFLCSSAGNAPFVKLLDFGVAKGLDDGTSVTTEGQAVGTLAYMSPEQITGGEVTVLSDLWAVGVVAFGAMTGQLPFKRETQSETIAAILGAPIPKPSDVAPELPATIDEWFARACNRTSQTRFQTPREMSDALWEALGVTSTGYRRGASQPQHPVPEPETGSPATITTNPIESQAKPLRPSRWLWAMLATSVIALVGAGIALLVVTVGRSAPADEPPVSARPSGAPSDADSSSSESPTPTPAPSTPSSASAAPPASAIPSAAPSQPAATTRSAPAAKPKPLPQKRRAVGQDDDLGF